jgi:hypothetical protein
VDLTTDLCLISAIRSYRSKINNALNAGLKPSIKELDLGRALSFSDSDRGHFPAWRVPYVP